MEKGTTIFTVAGIATTGALVLGYFGYDKIKKNKKKEVLDKILTILLKPGVEDFLKDLEYEKCKKFAKEVKTHGHIDPYRWCEYEYYKSPEELVKLDYSELKKYYEFLKILGVDALDEYELKEVRD